MTQLYQSWVVLCHGAYVINGIKSGTILSSEVGQTGNPLGNGTGNGPNCPFHLIEEMNEMGGMPGTMRSELVGGVVSRQEGTMNVVVHRARSIKGVQKCSKAKNWG